MVVKEAEMVVEEAEVVVVKDYKLLVEGGGVG